ncbi:hypothetical protein K457DRAFT_22878 [Linnemannia elongata AG-77]|uniref:Uncharacterized protein n=1 Tax=Linnemannia elongata AG-77 TaxID=1314771 RepID=A0A197JKC5_9FUNG|nr:hypothetical protein K457DRAFT_22878 [Linnemannia elongata AG-77]
MLSWLRCVPGQQPFDTTPLRSHSVGYTLTKVIEKADVRLNEWVAFIGSLIISEWTSTCLRKSILLHLTRLNTLTVGFRFIGLRIDLFSTANDTVRAYYAGDGLFVEIDIDHPPDTPLSQAHDLGESLQGALESLDNVERAFVHIGYNTVQAIEHR